MTDEHGTNEKDLENAQPERAPDAGAGDEGEYFTCAGCGTRLKARLSCTGPDGKLYCRVCVGLFQFFNKIYE